MVSSLTSALHCFASLTSEALERNAGRLDGVVFQEPTFAESGSQSPFLSPDRQRGQLNSLEGP